MTSYKSESGKTSGVLAYQPGEDFIQVKFANGDIYVYTHKSAGKRVIEKMKSLALQSKGLSTYISKNKPAFEKKL